MLLYRTWITVFVSNTVRNRLPNQSNEYLGDIIKMSTDDTDPLLYHKTVVFYLWYMAPLVANFASDARAILSNCPTIVFKLKLRSPNFSLYS